MKHHILHILHILGVVALALLILLGIIIATYELSSDIKPHWQPYVSQGSSHPAAKAVNPADDFYLSQIQPIFDSRCVACHGCLNSPCLLKLTSYEGLMRGARAINPDGIHLFPEAPVRLNDEPDLKAWRARGFFPVVDSEAPPEERLSRSLLHRMIAAGYATNQPGFPLEPLQHIYHDLNEHTCPDLGHIDHYLRQNPGAGMPFALPALDEDDFNTLSHWIAQGAPGPSPEAAAALARPQDPGLIARWEAFFNQDDPRAQLMARYIYEHSFLAIYHFQESPGERFRLVRSATPPGSPIHEIITERPFDNPFIRPDIDRVYYRLDKVTESLAQKSFFIWSLSEQDREHLNQLFLGTPWPETRDDPTSLKPGYDSHNPFYVFRAIPALARYTFLIENSKLIVSGMIRGPVCVGDLATYAIKDYFWAFLVSPEADPTVRDPMLGLQSWEDFTSFSVRGDDAYIQAYARTLDSYKPDGYSIDDIWDGGQHNPNAWLTILRHETNATVIHGRRGGIPATFWLVDFSGMERLYYALVANYTYWGSVKEKIATWEFMGFLRQEFEDNFLRLLPPEERAQYRDRWTSGLGQELLFTMPFPGENTAARTATPREEPISQVLAAIQQRMTEQVSGPRDPLNPASHPTADLSHPIQNRHDWEHAIASLTMRTHQSFTPFLPSVTFLRIRAGDQDWVYTLVANRSYAFNDVVFDQNGAAQPGLDTLSVYQGLVGDFPNLFIDITLDQAAPLLRQLAAIQTQDDWNTWEHRYATLRNQNTFWPTYDWFTTWNVTHNPQQAGYFDLTYYKLLNSNY